jgi:hypothetical protein
VRSVAGILLTPIALVLGSLPGKWFDPPEVPEEADDETRWDSYHPCMGCGTPLSTRRKFCDDQCRREYRMREINAEAPTERIDPSTTDIPF